MIGAMTGGTTRLSRLITLWQMLLKPIRSCRRVAACRTRSWPDGAPLRDLAPYTNYWQLGVQLAQSGGLDLARAAIDDLQADAIAIHLNLAEAVQPEGETDWTGVKSAIAALVESVATPVIVKEVGAGINAVLAAELFDMGGSC